MDKIIAGRLANKKWRDKNIEAERIRCAKWHRDNKDKRKQYKLKHRDKILRRRKELYILNRDKILAVQAEWRVNNKDKCYARSSKYAKNNPGKRAAWQRLRNALELKAAPPWLTKEQLKRIEALYVEAARLTKETKIKYSVDHIYPLQGKGFVGLHVPWNLRVMVISKNIRKKNHFPAEELI